MYTKLVEYGMVGVGLASLVSVVVGMVELVNYIG